MKTIFIKTTIFLTLIVGLVLVGSCKKEELPILVNSVILNKTEITIKENETASLMATVQPDNATNKEVIWKSNDKTIATVDKNGKVTAIKAGETTITVTAGEKTATCKVTVKAKFIALIGINLNKTEVTIKEDETVNLIPTIQPENATNKEVIWKSSDETIATVNSNGKVTAIKVGTADITATTGKKTATCKVRVKSPYMITFTTAKAIGEEIKLTINAKKEDRADVWIDLNNNGKRDNGEYVFFSDYNTDTYRIKSQTITIYGKIMLFRCYKNDIQSLNVSKNNALTYLSCRNNHLTSLDVSKNTALTKFWCYDNKLTNLDVSKNTQLKLLYFSTNQLTSLDVSKNTVLTKLFCDNNHLTRLNVANGNNTKMDIMKAHKNPNLKCIQIDTDFEPSTKPWNSSKFRGWKKDNSTQWSTKSCE